MRYLYTFCFSIGLNSTIKGVGKTCILFRFSDDAFTSTFISTIGKIPEIRRNSRQFKVGFGWRFSIAFALSVSFFLCLHKELWKGREKALLVFMDISRDDQLDSIISENRESSDDVFVVVVKSDRTGTNVASTDKTYSRLLLWRAVHCLGG